MIYPLIPEFLASIGTSKAVIGIIEGIAEATASLFRTVFGWLSDKIRKRKLFIFLGYGFSAFSKPFLYFANTWPAVLAVKFSDRMGKAARTPARDALISTSADKSLKGRAFGIHRAMDSMGAVIGPLLAIIVLSVSNSNVHLVFLFSVVPAVLALFLYILSKKHPIPLKKKASLKRRKYLKINLLSFL